MALLDRVKERTGSDLSDAELQAMIDGIAEELDARLGPTGAITVELGDLSDPDMRFRRSLRLVRPIDRGEAVTIVELDPGNSGTATAELALAADDYAIRHNGRTIHRLVSGTNGRDYWAPLVRITYTPTGEAAARDEATIKLIQLDLSYRGMIKSERAGDYQWASSLSSDSFAKERENIIDALAQRRGMVMA